LCRRKRAAVFIRAPCRARARVGESGECFRVVPVAQRRPRAPSTLSCLSCLVLSVCRAPTLGTSLATLFSLAKPFDGPALDTPFARFPFFRAVMVMSSLGCPIWRTPRTMNVLAYAASSGEPFPYLFVCPQPAQSRRSPSLTRSQLGVSPIASQRLLPEPPRCLPCFLELCSSCSHRTSQKPAKPMARHHHNDHPANLR